MSFSYKFKTLRSGNSYDSSAQLEIAAHEEEVTGVVELNANEGNEENRVRFSPDLVDERIKASLERLHAQISALTEMMDCLIQSNSARKATTASTRETQYQNESPPGRTFFGKMPLFFRYSGGNAANAVNLQAKRR